MDTNLIDRLETVDTLVWYNGPVLWTARVPGTELLYLVYTSEEFKDFDTWLITPTTEEVVSKLKTNQIPIYLALNHPGLYRVRVVVTANPILCMSVEPIDLDLDVAPDKKPTPDVFLHYVPEPPFDSSTH